MGHCRGTPERKEKSNKTMMSGKKVSGISLLGSVHYEPPRDSECSEAWGATSEVLGSDKWLPRKLIEVSKSYKSYNES